MDNNKPEEAASNEQPVRESLQEQLKRGEEAFKKARAEAEGTTVPSESNVVGDIPPDVEKKEEKVPDQFRKPDGNVDEEKLSKSTEELKRSLEVKKTMLEAYKTLQAEFTKTSQAVKETQKQTPAAEVPESVAALKKEFQDLLDKDPSEALLKAVTLGKQYALSEVEQREAQRNAQTREQRWLESLDKYAVSDPWIYSEEGLGAIKEVLSQRPYLYSGGDPYGDALAFVDKTKFKSAPLTENSSRTNSGTPVLSGSKGVVPSSSSQPVSDIDLLKSLKDSLATAVSTEEKRGIVQKMDMLAKKLMGKSR